MIPDVKLNGKSVREMGWIRENIDFPTPQSQTNTIVVPGRNSPIRYTEADPLLRKGTITLECTDGDSYFYHVKESEVVISGSGTVTLQNDFMPVVPVVITTGETAFSWRIGEDTYEKSVSAGTWEFPEMELGAGENRLSVKGEGVTTFRYREGRL